MGGSLITLPVGILVIVAAFFTLWRLTPVRAKFAAAVVGFVSLMGYAVVGSFTQPDADVVAVHVTGYLVTAYILGFLASHRERGKAGGFHWGPATIVGFFAVIIAANSILIIVSRGGVPEWLGGSLLPEPAGSGEVRSVFPGTVSHNYQQKEGQYNEYQLQVKRQKERGWQIRKGWVGPAAAGRSAVFQVHVSDSEGAPVTGASVNGEFQRPADSRLDRAFELVEYQSGLYRAEVNLPVPGVWNLVLHVRRGEDVHEVRASTTVD